MKIILSCCLAFVCASVAYSQNINYQKNYDAALANAKTENKLLFVYIGIPALKITQIEGKKVTYKSGIEDAEVAKFYNQNFVNYKTIMTDTAATRLRIKYRLNRFPSYLFIDAQGNIVYTENQNSSNPERYLKMGNQALAAVASGKTVTGYEKRYNSGERSLAFLREYIEAREKSGNYDNARLIDEYVDFLTVGQLNDYHQVLFILQAGPYAFGKAYTLIYTNKPVIDSIYKKEPAMVRSDINNRIINNTMTKAIAEKNISLAQRAANISMATWSKDYRRASIAMNSRMLQYYRAVKDTFNYYNQAAYFYDNNYMTISADSSKRIEQHNLDNLRKTRKDQYLSDTAIKNHAGHDSIRRVSMLTQVNAVSVSPANSTATILNNAAYTFYELGTRKPANLTKALLWSKRSIELNPIAPYYDTLAHLLYRLEFYDEAIVAENKAIELGAKTHTDLDFFKKELAKMKQRTL